MKKSQLSAIELMAKKIIKIYRHYGAENQFTDGCIEYFFIKTEDEITEFDEKLNKFSCQKIHVLKLYFIPNENRNISHHIKLCFSKSINNKSMLTLKNFVFEKSYFMLSIDETDDVAESINNISNKIMLFENLNKQTEKKDLTLNKNKTNKKVVKI